MYAKYKCVHSNTCKLTTTVGIVQKTEWRMCAVWIKCKYVFPPFFSSFLTLYTLYSIWFRHGQTVRLLKEKCHEIFDPCFSL